MSIEISFDTSSAVEGVDQSALIEDIEAEIRKLAKSSNAKLTRNDTPAPSGAQGELQLIEWILELAKDPKMAVLYAKGIIFAINQIIEAVSPKDESKEQQKKQTTIKVLGKKISLPATTIAIQEFLKSLGDE
jgi:hypothetical protein